MTHLDPKQNVADGAELQPGLAGGLGARMSSLHELRSLRLIASSRRASCAATAARSSPAGVLASAEQMAALRR
jgi:hypothetical protein